MKYKDLSIQEKAALFKRLAQGGFLKNVKPGNAITYIEQMYDNRYADGGEKDEFKTVRQRDDFKPSKVKKWIADKIGPLAYPNPVGIHGDFSRMYFGRPLQENTFYRSNYTPTKASDPNAQYYGVKSPEFLHDLVYHYNKQTDKLTGNNQSMIIDGYQARINSDTDKGYLDDTIERHLPSGDLPRMSPSDKEAFISKGLSALGNFTVSRNHDEKGDYLSYYDLWDVDPSMSYNIEKRGIAKPYEIYDRIYGTFDMYDNFHPFGEIQPSVITADRKRAEGGFLKDKSRKK